MSEDLEIKNNEHPYMSVLLVVEARKVGMREGQIVSVLRVQLRQGKKGTENWPATEVIETKPAVFHTLSLKNHQLHCALAVQTVPSIVNLPSASDEVLQVTPGYKYQVEIPALKKKWTEEDEARRQERLAHPPPPPDYYADIVVKRGRAVVAQIVAGAFDEAEAMMDDAEHRHLLIGPPAVVARMRVMIEKGRRALEPPVVYPPHPNDAHHRIRILGPPHAVAPEETTELEPDDEPRIRPRMAAPPGMVEVIQPNQQAEQVFRPMTAEELAEQQAREARFDRPMGQRRVQEEMQPQAPPRPEELDAGMLQDPQFMNMFNQFLRNWRSSHE